MDIQQEVATLAAKLKSGCVPTVERVIEIPNSGGGKQAGVVMVRRLSRTQLAVAMSVSKFSMATPWNREANVHCQLRMAIVGARDLTNQYGERVEYEQVRDAQLGLVASEAVIDALTEDALMLALLHCEQGLTLSMRKNSDAPPVTSTGGAQHAKLALRGGEPDAHVHAVPLASTTSQSVDPPHGPIGLG